MTNSVLPEFLLQYFWGDDVSQLDIEHNQKYIVQTLLEKGDSGAIKWLFLHIDKQTIKNFLPTLQLGKKSANFWSIYLS